MTYSGLIERAIHAASGLEAHITDIQIDLAPLQIVTEDVQFFNPEVDYPEPVLTVGHFSAAMDVGGYLRGAPNWWQSQASGVVARFAEDKHGRSIWSRADGKTRPPDPQPDEASGTPLLGFGDIDISDLDILRIMEGQTHRLHVSTLSLKKLSDERLELTLDARYQDQPLSASGTLALPGSTGSRPVRLHATVFGSELNLEGTLGNDGVSPGTATLSVSAKDLSSLSRLLHYDLNAFAPVELAGTLGTPKPGHWTVAAQGQLAGMALDVNSTATLDGPTYQLDDLALRLGNSSIKAKGVVQTAAKSLNATISADRLDLNQLSATLAPGKGAAAPSPTAPSASAAGINLNPFDPWSIDANVELAELDYQNYRLKGLTLKTSNENQALRLKGHVQRIEKNADQGGAWQFTEPLEVDASVHGKGGNDSPSSLKARFNARGLKGELDATLPGAGKAQLSLQASADNLSALQGIDTTRWAALLPLAVNLQADLTESQIQIDPIKISLGEDDLRGRLQIDRAATPPKISGDLQATTLDVNHFSTVPAPPADGAVAEPDKGSGKVFSDQAIDWSWLDAAVVDVGMHIDQFIFNQTKFSKVRTKVQLNNGQLVVDPIDANLAKGGVRGQLRIHRKGSGAEVTTRLVVTELTPADLGEANRGLMDGGETDLSLDLRSSGASAHQLAAGLNGDIALEIQRATVRNSLFERFGSDILMQTITLINPFAKREESTELQCAAVHFEAKDGVLSSNDEIVIETSKMKIRGGGEINLKDETLRIDFVPVARQGLGINVGDLVSFVRIGGTLRHPQPVADPKGILKSGATIGAAIATSGVSLLAKGLYDRMRSGGTACGKIFENNTDVPKAIETSDPETGSKR